VTLRKPGLLAGGLIGAFLTAPLVALFYAGWKLAGLPFPPFNVFDWIARILPGRVITFGIDSMVKAIRALGIADTASAAKAAEQSLAIAVFLLAGVLVGAVLFAVLRALRTSRAVLAGIVVGAGAAAAAIAIGRSLGRPSIVAPLLGDVWTAAAFLAWGAALGLANRRLTRLTIEFRG